MTAKPISIKVAGCKSGGCAWKAVELTSGDLFIVVDSRLGHERSGLTGEQKSAEGVVADDGLSAKARTVLRKGG